MAAIVVLEMQVKPEAVSEVKAFLKKILPDTRSYAGCQGLDIYSNSEDPTNLLFYERWDSHDQYKKYLAWRQESGAMSELVPKLAAPPKIRYFNREDL